MSGSNISVRLYADMVRAYSRGVLRGIANYAKLHGGWDFKFDSLADPDITVSFVNDDVRGIIIQIRRSDQAEQLLEARRPVVNVANVITPPAPLPTVIPDDDAIGKMAAEYFLDRGFTNFAYCGLTGQRFSQMRGDGFSAALAKTGHRCTMLERADNESASCADELRKLPQPLAVFCCNDSCAKATVQDVVAMGLQVPDQVAVLGVDNDEINCELAGVQLSSIRLNTEEIGYTAADLLSKLIAGEPPPEKPILIPPVEVITRRSSDVLALSDPEVAAVVRFIRDSGGRDINVDDLLKHTSLSRRSLEMRFRKALNRSPFQEIRRVQLERAQLLLARTDRPVREIADACGFKESRQLSIAFHERLGLTPRQYRRRSRPMGNFA
ncbi:MAG: substrate-binding domain-containing protein [Tepidisphaeraceae bacterium]|jgi:LacI family transcriptional regulator